MRASRQISKNKKKNIISPIDDPNLNLWVLLDQTRDVISKARELELVHYKLSRVQAAVLHILLVENRGMTIGEISNWNVREPNSVLSLVNRMEKIGLVKKVRNAGDDKIRIVITEKGQKSYTSASRLSIEMIFSALTDEEKQQLNSSLRKLRSKARELLGIDFKPLFLP
jgi:DNA-binding MarR family transcriptional regulator